MHLASGRPRCIKAALEAARVAQAKLEMPCTGESEAAVLDADSEATLTEALLPAPLRAGLEVHGTAQSTFVAVCKAALANAEQVVQKTVEVNQV